MYPALSCALDDLQAVFEINKSLPIEGSRRRVCWRYPETAMPLTFERGGGREVDGCGGQGSFQRPEWALACARARPGFEILWRGSSSVAPLACYPPSLFRKDDGMTRMKLLIRCISFRMLSY
jgi:hypothetical protein